MNDRRKNEVPGRADEFVNRPFDARRWPAPAEACDGHCWIATQVGVESACPSVRSKERQLNRAVWLVVVLCVVLGALPVAAFARQFLRTRQQATTVARLKSLGGQVTYDFEQGNPTRDRTPLQRILGDDFSGTVVKVDLSHARVTDNDLIILRDLPAVTWLSLYDTAISDEGLNSLA